MVQWTVVKYKVSLNIFLVLTSVIMVLYVGMVIIY